MMGTYESACDTRESAGLIVDNDGPIPLLLPRADSCAHEFRGR
jgi:hypothetical protein